MSFLFQYKSREGKRIYHWVPGDSVRDAHRHAPKVIVREQPLREYFLQPAEGAQ